VLIFNHPVGIYSSHGTSVGVTNLATMSFQPSSGLVHFIPAWNPIGVDGHVALTEYKSYVQALVSALENDFVEDCIKSTLLEMELEYDPQNEILLMEIRNLASLLKTVYKEHCYS